MILLTTQPCLCVCLPACLLSAPQGLKGGQERKDWEPAGVLRTGRLAMDMNELLVSTTAGGTPTGSRGGGSGGGGGGGGGECVGVSLLDQQPLPP